MYTRNNKATIARIEVQQNFCQSCASFIKKELQRIDEVKNIRFYPQNSLITFNFANAYMLSEALNALSEIGYYEKGEATKGIQFKVGHCPCKVNF